MRSAGSALDLGAVCVTVTTGVACWREGRPRGVGRLPTPALAGSANIGAGIDRACELGVIDSETVRSADSAWDLGRDVPQDSRESRSREVATDVAWYEREGRSRGIW